MNGRITVEIEDYLNSLPADTIIINIHNKQITHISACILLRFENLTTFICSSNKLAVLPILPNSLLYLHCQDNELTSLPISLPPNLYHLNCNANRLTHLPRILPAKLRWLLCSGNELSELPELLSAELTGLICSHNRLTKLPACLSHDDSRVIKLDARNNQLTFLPIMPRGLAYLYVSYNRLTNIASLLHTACLRLDFRGNNISACPPIPNGVELDFSDTPLQYVFRKLYGKSPVFMTDKHVNKIKVIYNFRWTYYYGKLQRKMKDWLWERVRLPKINAMYSPAQLERLLAGIPDNTPAEEAQAIIDAW